MNLIPDEAWADTQAPGPITFYTAQSQDVETTRITYVGVDGSIYNERVSATLAQVLEHAGFGFSDGPELDPAPEPQQPQYEMVYRCTHNPWGQKCGFVTTDYSTIDAHEEQLEPGHWVSGQMERVKNR